MLCITERAMKELKKILSDNVDVPQARLRLVARKQGQVGLGIDIETPGDQVFEHEGSRLLIVDEKLACWLEGAVLDIEDTSDGYQLVIRQ